MDKEKLLIYLQDRRDLYISLTKQAIDKDNDGLCFTYMAVADEIDRLIFVVHFEKEVK